MNNQRTNGRTYTNRTSGTYTNRTNYIYDNTARKIDVQRQLEEPQRRVLSREIQANRAKAKHMNLGYVAFLVAALAVAAVVLIGYIKVQAEITTTMEYITTREKVLNNLKISNDEYLTRIESNIDLEEVKRVAIGELGMTYPEEGQIISYESVEYDYVRRVSDEE